MKIHSIQLQTPDLDATIRFYNGVLGMPVSGTAPGTAGFRTGRSALIFTENPEFRGVYHFAFNIPCNQIGGAIDWLRGRGVDLIADPAGQTRIDFASWHAEATYFLDPAGNIVEFIARRDLNNASEAPFGPESLLEISEIAIVVPDVPAWRGWAAQEYGVHLFDKGVAGPEFSALGADSGLFIVAKEGRHWFLTTIPATPAPLEVRFENDAGKVFVLREP